MALRETNVAVNQDFDKKIRGDVAVRRFTDAVNSSWKTKFGNILIVFDYIHVLGALKKPANIPRFDLGDEKGKRRWATLKAIRREIPFLHKQVHLQPTSLRFIVSPPRMTTRPHFDFFKRSGPVVAKKTLLIGKCFVSVSTGFYRNTSVSISAYTNCAATYSVMCLSTRMRTSH